MNPPKHLFGDIINPVPFPKRCRCCRKVVNNYKEKWAHDKDCICIRTLSLLVIESDRWEPV